MQSERGFEREFFAQKETHHRRKLKDRERQLAALRAQLVEAPAELLGLVLGALQNLQFVFASSLRLPLASGIEAGPATAVLFPLTTFVVLLTYVEERTDGFRIMIRDSPASISSGTYSSLLNDAVSQVSSILAGDFSRRGLDPDLAPLYAQALVGSVSMTAQWWLDTREPKKEVVAAHLVNLMWNGLTHLEADPQLQDE